MPSGKKCPFLACSPYLATSASTEDWPSSTNVPSGKKRPFSAPGPYRAISASSELVPSGTKVPSGKYRPGCPSGPTPGTPLCVEKKTLRILLLETLKEIKKYVTLIQTHL